MMTGMARAIRLTRSSSVSGVAGAAATAVDPALFEHEEEAALHGAATAVAAQVTHLYFEFSRLDSSARLSSMYWDRSKWYICTMTDARVENHV